MAKAPVLGFQPPPSSAGEQMATSKPIEVKKKVATTQKKLICDSFLGGSDVCIKSAAATKE